MHRAPVSPLIVLVIGLLAATGAAAATLVNASHDPTRELYRAVNAAFAAGWLARTGAAAALETATTDGTIIEASSFDPPSDLRAGATMVLVLLAVRAYPAG